MKKILITLLLFLTLVTPSYALTERVGTLTTQRENLGSSSAARQNLKVQTDEAKIANLKERAKTEITRRENFLNDLSAKISNIKKISDADKTTLKTQLQQQIDGLTTLLAKIDSDTDLVTLKEDVKSIVNGYYIFAFFRVKINLLIAAERLSLTTENLSVVYNKLAARIAEQKGQGKDVVSIETLLADMLAKSNDAKIQYQAVETELSALVAQGFPGNKSTLMDARSKIKLGSQDLKTAFIDATKIRQGLGNIGGNLKPKNGTGSALKSDTSRGQE